MSEGQSPERSRTGAATAMFSQTIFQGTSSRMPDTGIYHLFAYLSTKNEDHFLVRNRPELPKFYRRQQSD
jgi:hypothetical protein